MRQLFDEAPRLLSGLLDELVDVGLEFRRVDLPFGEELLQGVEPPGSRSSGALALSGFMVVSASFAKRRVVRWRRSCKVQRVSMVRGWPVRG